MDAQTGVFGYRVDKPPFYMRKAANIWRIQAEGSEKTIVEMQAEIELIPILGWITFPLIKRQLRTFGKQFIEELKYHAETGAIHPRKLKARAKASPQTSS